MAAARKKGGSRGKMRKAQAMMRDALVTAQDTVQARVGSAREQAGETWDALETLFQSRVRKVLAELRVPAGEEIRKLAARVAELGDAVERLSARAGGPRGKAHSGRGHAGAHGKPRATAKARRAPKRTPRRVAR